jgi:hypothetical protein
MGIFFAEAFFVRQIFRQSSPLAENFSSPEKLLQDLLKCYDEENFPNEESFDEELSAAGQTFFKK